MRRLLVLLMVAGFGVGVSAPIAAAGFDKASGHVDNGFQVWDFSATSNFNGSEPRGSVKLTLQDRDPNTVYTGKVTCLSVVGNTFQATGPITAVRNPEFPGFPAMSFLIQGSDSGKFATDANPDTFAGSINFFDPPAACLADGGGQPVFDGDVIVQDSNF
jgi:hypothetical protein